MYIYVIPVLYKCFHRTEFIPNLFGKPMNITLTLKPNRDRIRKKNSDQATEYRSKNPEQDISKLNLEEEVRQRKAECSVQGLKDWRLLHRNRIPESKAITLNSVFRGSSLLMLINRIVARRLNFLKPRKISIFSTCR